MEGLRPVEGCREAHFADFLGMALEERSVKAGRESMGKDARSIREEFGAGRTPLRAALAAREALALCLPVTGPRNI